jgi:pyrroloquinoline quinone (PQQ) biosynthesis protein C
MLAMLRRLSTPWGDERIGTEPRYDSDVTDDHSPYEFSLALGGGSPEVRLLIEAQGEPPSLRSNWAAGIHLTEQIAREYQLPLDRFRRVQELLSPSDTSRLGIWHSVCFWADRPPEFKLYLDAQALGRWRAPARVDEALAALGISGAWTVLSQVARRGPQLDEFKYLSLDLSRESRARVKVYVRHHDALIEDLEAITGDAGFMDPGMASEFCRAILIHDGPYQARPIFSCTSFVEQPKGKGAKNGATWNAAARTLYLPIGGYVAHDAMARARISEYLKRHDLGADIYHDALKSFAERRLEEGVGLHSYVSLRREPKGGRRVTTYLSPEAFQTFPARGPAAPKRAVSGARRRAVASPRDAQSKDAQLPPEEIVRRHEHDIVLPDHPFFMRMGRDPVNLSHLWLILANFWEGVVHDFPQRLSHVVAKIEDDRFKCIFAKQLNDELGEGDFARAHKAMFRTLVNALAPHRMSGKDDELLAPGREFSRRLGVHLYSPDAYESIGALMMIEVYGKQVDVRLGAEFRRQNVLDPAALTWLHLHEDLEVDHADDSLRLALMLPREGAELEAVWKGALGVVSASFAYFDALYRLCYA